MDQHFVGIRKTLPPPQFNVIDGLAVEGVNLDLGEVWEQENYPYDLVIHNQNEGAAEIFDFGLSCGCVESIEPRSLIIAPGATATVRLRLDLAKRTSGERGLSRRPFEVEIRPLRKSPRKPEAGWSLHGIIKSRVTLSTRFLDFGDSMVRGQPPPERRVTAVVHVTDAALRTRVVPDQVRVQVRPLESSPRQFDLILSPHRTLPVGSFACKVHIDLLTKDGEHLPGVVLPVSGKTQPEVRAIPAQLVFGPRRLGQTAESSVTLQVPKGEDWVVEHIETDSSDVRVDAVENRDGRMGCVFRIRQHITKPGRQASTIRFFVRKGRGDPVPLSMEVSYEGDPAGVLSQSNKEAGQ